MRLSIIQHEGGFTVKRKHIVIGAVAVFVILAAIGGASNSGTVAADPVTTPAPVAASTPAPTPVATPEVLEVSSLTPVTLVKVIDGDTIDVKIDGKEERIRVLGIDAPEMDTDAGREAKTAAMMALTIEDTTLAVEADANQGERDKYGRLLRHVVVLTGDDEGALFGAVMIASGYATRYTKYGLTMHDDMLLAAEAEAKAIAAESTPEPTAEPVDEEIEEEDEEEPKGKRYSSCAKALDAGQPGNWTKGDPEYKWYADGDGDGVVCEN
jgi:micrococcal nuclease